MSLPYGFSGDYRSWHDAERLCTGDQPEFRVKAMQAALAVVEGRAAHARDGATFASIVYSWPLLAGLMYVAARSEGRIRVMDFGGGPAVTFLQNRRFLSRFPSVDWRIVEKPDYCGFCRVQMPLPGVSFHESIDAALSLPGLPDAVILASVLAVLEDPYSLLRALSGRGLAHILIDRSWMSLEGRDRLAVFRADASAHENMSRPFWFMDERHLREVLKDYELVEKFPVQGLTAPFPAELAGYIFSRRGDR